jgi:hypothetical protein
VCRLVDLPEPLLTHSLYDVFLAAWRSEDRQNAMIRVCLCVCVCVCVCVCASKLVHEAQGGQAACHAMLYFVLCALVCAMACFSSDYRVSGSGGI